MALTFNHASSLIGVPQADAAPLLIQSLVNAIRDEEASERGIVHDQICDATGKADLGGSVLTGITLALRDSWKIDFTTGSYQATVDGGNLADGLDRINNTGSPQVILRSSVATTIAVTGSGVTPSDITDIADAITSDSKTLTVAKFLGLK